MNKKSTLKLILHLFFGWVLIFQVSHAQTYPVKPLRLIVTYAPGGTADVLAREIGNKMSLSMGQQVVVENKAGASGVIGADALAKAAPDGYSFGLLSSGHTALPFATKLPFELLRDFVPIAIMASVPGVLSVNSAVAAKDLQELLSLAQNKPGVLNSGNPGNLSAGHLAIEMLKIQSKVDIVSIPYKGGGPALADLIGGQLTMMVAGPASQMPHLISGKLRAIAVNSLVRTKGLPSVPTIAESGFPDFELNEWYGFFAPSKVSQDIVLKLNQEIIKAIQTQDVQKRMLALGAESSNFTPDQFGGFVKKESEKLGHLVKTLNLKAE